jgi:hypothetical protein
VEYIDPPERVILSPLAPSIDEAVEYRCHFRVWHF